MSRLVVIDRQKVFAESEWSAWACADGTYYDTNEAFAKLAKAFGDRVVYTRYIAPQPPQNAWIDYFKDWPQFLVAPDDPMYDLTDDTAALAKGHAVVSCDTFGKWGDALSEVISDAKKITVCGSPPTVVCLPPCSPPPIAAWQCAWPPMPAPAARPKTTGWRWIPWRCSHRWSRLPIPIPSWDSFVVK